MHHHPAEVIQDLSKELNQECKSQYVEVKVELYLSLKLIKENNSNNNRFWNLLCNLVQIR